MSVKDNSFGIAELQNKMLDILKYYISICNNNQLRYWVGGGTCLGAIRHKGFRCFYAKRGLRKTLGYMEKNQQ